MTTENHPQSQVWDVNSLLVTLQHTTRMNMAAWDTLMGNIVREQGTDAATKYLHERLGWLSAALRVMEDQYEDFLDAFTTEVAIFDSEFVPTTLDKHARYKGGQIGSGSCLDSAEDAHRILKRIAQPALGVLLNRSGK